VGLRPTSPQHEAGIRVEIRNNGQGLPQEALRAVFDPFSLRDDRQQEFGINLMACYFIVYHHGGQMSVRSQEGNGMALILTLPAQPRARSAIEEEQLFLTQMLMNESLWEKLLATA